MMLASKREPAIVVVVEQPTRTEYVDRRVSITENRAPTDESVKLLREMEAKAEAEVIKAVSVGNTIFECVVHQVFDVLSDQMHWRTIFSLNGRQMVAEIEAAGRFDLRDGVVMQEAFAKLRDEMAKVIAAEVLNDAFVAAIRERFQIS